MTPKPVQIAKLRDPVITIEFHEPFSKPDWEKAQVDFPQVTDVISAAPLTVTGLRHFCQRRPFSATMNVRFQIVRTEVRHNGNGLPTKP